MKEKYTDQELYDLFSTIVSDQSKIPYDHSPIEIRCQNVDELQFYAELCQQMMTDAVQLVSAILPNLTLEIDRQQYDSLLSTCTKTILEKPFNLFQGDTLIVYFKNSPKKSFELQGLNLSMEHIGKSLNYAKAMWEAQSHLLTVCLAEKECCLGFIRQLSSFSNSTPKKLMNISK